MKIKLKNMAAFLVLMISMNAFAHDDLKKTTLGQSLHDAKCLACHTTETYTRENHTMKSIDALSTRVAQCMKPAKAEWNDKEKEAVINYISKSFYKF